MLSGTREVHIRAEAYVQCSIDFEWLLRAKCTFYWRDSTAMKVLISGMSLCARMCGLLPRSVSAVQNKSKPQWGKKRSQNATKDKRTQNQIGMPKRSTTSLCSEAPRDNRALLLTSWLQKTPCTLIDMIDGINEYINLMSCISLCINFDTKWFSKMRHILKIWLLLTYGCYCQTFLSDEK